MNKRINDVGGMPAGPIDFSEHSKRWHTEFTALLWVLIGPKRKIMALDEMRRAVEDLGPEYYDKMPYYDRQIHATATILVEHGYLTWDEINTHMKHIAKPKEF